MPTQIPLLPEQIPGRVFGTFANGQRYYVDYEPPGGRVSEGPCVELRGSGYYFAPFDKLSALDAARLIYALEGK